MYQEESRRKEVVAYSDFLSSIRRFMQDNKIQEVITNPLVSAVVPDHGVDPVSVSLEIGQRYLHTSPEWEMKKLLAEGSGSIYQMVSVFRDDLNQNWHKPAFLMLEWYEIGIDDEALIQQCLALLEAVGIHEPAEIVSVHQLYQKYCHLDSREISVEIMQDYCAIKGIESDNLQDPNQLSSWLELLWVNDIEPNLQGLVVVKEFHPCQSALAKIVANPYPHAKRFEIFLHGCELANGYYETTDIQSLRERFAAYDGFDVVNVDDIINMPECSGVSIGIDRLYAQKNEHASLFQD